MAFPATPLGIKVELDLNGTWTDITSKVYQRDDISIVHGKRDEGAGTADASRMTLTLNNRDGRFSPRNPSGTYYGTIGRNTPIRLSADGTDVRLLTQSVATADAPSCPDSAALDIVGDIDIRADISMLSWNSTLGNDTLVRKGLANSGQHSWLLSMSTAGGGRPRLQWSTDGTALIAVVCSAGVPNPQYGRKTIRATLDVNNGLGGYTVVFYTGDSVDGPWTQLGTSTVTTGGTTSIFAGSGASAKVYIAPDYAEVYKVKVLQGIAGTERANPDFTAQATGATSFADAAGNTWTIGSFAEVTNRRNLFRGEVSAWPVAWESSGSDSWVPIEASGILRRLQQGDAPLKSVMYQGDSALSDLVAYWPLEDESSATSFGSATGGSPMTWVGTPTLATNDDFVASKPLPTLSNSQWHGIVPNHTNTGDVQLRFLLKIPSAGSTDGARVVRLYTTGSIKYWDVVYNTAGTGTLIMRGYDISDAEVVTSGTLNPSWGLEGSMNLVSVELAEDGSDVDWTVAIFQVGNSVGTSSTGTETSSTVGRAAHVWIDYNGNMDDVVVGHVSVQNGFEDIESTFILPAYSGETAAGRMNRLFENEGITLGVIGAEGNFDDPDFPGSTLMGPQLSMRYLELVWECERTDGGILFDATNFAGFIYRTRDGLYTQDSALTLDYDAAELSNMEPVDDDQLTRNDITVSRPDGSSTRVIQTDGPLSISAPPDGVGRYETSVDINVQDDAQLLEQANWRLALGTIDQTRYPKISIALARSAFSAADRQTIMDMRIGDRITVANPPAWLPPDDIHQIVIGRELTLNAFKFDVVFVCVPASAYDVAFYDAGDEARYSPSVPSTLNSSATSSTTSLSVATSVLPLWTTAAAQFPFDVVVGGERMTVTNITGASSPQTFTVTRSVNGVVKAHSSGAVLELFTPAYYAL